MACIEEQRHLGPLGTRGKVIQCRPHPADILINAGDDLKPLSCKGVAKGAGIVVRVPEVQFRLHIVGIADQ